jgi:CubicO group peptidase (beta-lactamase class C family)
LSLHDVDGNIHLPNGASMTARESAKFGLLIQHHGNWQGRQIVPAKLLQECFIGTTANPRYGLTFWLRSVKSVPKDFVMAHGRGKQVLYIIPSLDLVIVQFAETEQYEMKDFLERLLVSVKEGRAAHLKNRRQMAIASDVWSAAQLVRPTGEPRGFSSIGLLDV